MKVFYFKEAKRGEESLEEQIGQKQLVQNRKNYSDRGENNGYFWRHQLMAVLRCWKCFIA